MTHPSIHSLARLQWDNRAQYLLTLLGYAVGLGNIWRFSYLVAKNGGATFVIPYLLMLFVVGIPLFYLESLLGQALQKGPILAWYKLCPNLWGIGLSAIVVTVYISLYYNIIISWVILYFFNSFQDPLPWAKCNGQTINRSSDFYFDHINETDYASCVNDSTRYYWYVNSLQASSDIDVAGGFNWRLLLTLCAAWIIVYLCIFKGIKSSGKVVYFTATFPYLMLTVLFFRAVTLDGAGDGLDYLFIPKADVIKEKFFQPQVWLEAATQIFFSLGLSLGAIIALSSYSKPSNNALVDTLVVCLTNSFTSIYASIVVFSIVGFKANELDTSIELVSQGPGLAFIVFTEALTLFPVSPLWALLFFFMLFLLGLDSQFAGLEAIITVLYDSKKIRKVRKEIIIAIICILMFFASFPFILGNGPYLFQLFDQFVGTLPLLFIGLCEVLCISYVYGVDKFFALVKYPVHRYMKIFWWFVWTFVSPVVMIIIFFGSTINELVEPLQYTIFAYSEKDGIKTEQVLPYPDWAQFIGAVLVLTSILCVPGVLIVRLIAYHKARKQMKEFKALTIQRGINIYEKARNFVLRTQSWTPHEDEEENGEIPYQSCDEDNDISETEPSSIDTSGVED